ncbi:hypothetical protein [Nocardia farcinica]|uniref:hypothetical protein n=1 Tax=Nocardia farcinica TaxID=37329 RepID=UPI001894326D|nr:hypothetical protein [Nocardia farcinica]MBF6410958.1 hypothetical protein [Nocardia farcinica]
MRVTIEGVASTDVLERGEQTTVEWTDYLRGLVRAGLVRVVDWHHPAPVEVAQPDPDDAGAPEPEPVEQAAPKRARRRAADQE